MIYPKMIQYQNSQTKRYFITDFKEKEFDYASLRLDVKFFYYSRIEWVLFMRFLRQVQLTVN